MCNAIGSGFRLSRATVQRAAKASRFQLCCNYVDFIFRVGCCRFFVQCGRGCAAKDEMRLTELELVRFDVMLFRFKIFGF